MINGAAFKSAWFNNDGRGDPLVRIRDVGQDNTQVHYDGPFEKRHVIEHGDVLIGMDGDFRAAPWKGQRALLNQRVCSVAVRDQTRYSEHFLLHVLQPYLDAVHAVTSSVTVKHLSSKTVQDLPLPLPPRAEQDRIVAAIEEHLSRLDAAERASRSAHSRLSSLWEGTLREAFDLGSERIELNEVNAEDRPICYGILKPKSPDPGVVPYVEVRSISKGQVKVEELHRTTQALHDAFPRSVLRAGDVVLAVRGSFDRAAVVPESLAGANVSRDVARISPKEELLADFLAAFLVSPEARSYFRAHARGVAVQGVNIGDLRRLPVPVPSVPEQEAAMAQIQRFGDGLAHIEEEIRQAEKRASSLRRAILVAAFSGQLVPQDPDDEPASVLLEQIAAERAAAGPPKRRRKAASA